MARKSKTKYFYAPLLIGLLYVVTNLLLPIYQSYWGRYITAIWPLFDAKYLGLIYVILGCICALIVLTIALTSKPEKHPWLRLGGAFAAIFLLLPGIQMLFPIWFNMIFIV